MPPNTWYNKLRNISLHLINYLGTGHFVSSIWTLAVFKCFFWKPSLQLTFLSLFAKILGPGLTIKCFTTSHLLLLLKTPQTITGQLACTFIKGVCQQSVFINGLNCMLGVYFRPLCWCDFFCSSLHWHCRPCCLLKKKKRRK